LTADIGAVGKDRPIIVGAQLKLPPRPPGNVKVAHVSISYSIPSQEIEDNTCSRDVFMEYTSDQSLCTQVDREVIGYFSQINAQKFIEQAIAETKQGNISDATRSLFEAQEITQRLGNLPLAENIKETIKELGRSGTISENGIKTIKAGSRFTIRLDKAKNSEWDNDKDNVKES
jgi:Ca-activated chloride channel family protein